MIKAYLTWISTPYEGEDMEIRYRIFKDEELIVKESIFEEYTKPALCGLVSMSKLLKELEKHIKDEIVVVINDGALFEMLNGTSRTKKEEVQYLGHKVRKAIDKFYNIRIENISGNHLEIQEWSNILKP
ncbi:MAG: hypothetical protein GX787_06885 [Tissierellia bacterium]|jgi:hypothetical protein|nr:hypothetical protein [Tissierellia bacterium]